MSRPRRFASASVALLCLGLLSVGGCSVLQEIFKTDATRLLAPEKVIRRPSGSPINPIYGSISPADTSQELVPNSTPPREGDWTYTDREYVIGPTDVVDISVLDLFQVGLETVLRREVSASGFIPLPLLSERIKAEGLTQEQLKGEVIKAYSVEILRDPTVTVSVVGRRQNVFSILGAIARPGQFNIVRKDMRLLEALAMAGGITQANIRYIYVIRPTPAIRVAVGEPHVAEPTVVPPEELPALPPEAPPTTPETETEKEAPVDVEKALRELGAAMPGAEPEMKPAEQPTPSVMPRLTETEASPAGTAPPVKEVEQVDTSRSRKWIYTADGKWVEVAQEATVATRPSGAGTPPVRPAGLQPQVPGEPEPDPFGWRKLDKSELARIIAINLNKLRDGDQRMNIIVRENDIIRIPTLEVGEFYVTGEVLRPGVYSLIGRRVTVKMAMAAAGNLGPLAWPENSILIRRIGDNQEQIISLDIQAIFRGEEPDRFLKPNDVIAVGTDPRAIFYAVVRNAFRMTYGFGFIYDRNFADPFWLPLDSKRFTRW